MSDDKLELSRRKILGSVGAVGAAGAAAGLGTSALFSDEESFTNNSITAGTLDLKIGWEEHYFDGKNRLDFSGNSDISASDVEYVDGSLASGRTTLPLDATSPQNGAAVSVPDQATALDLLDVTEVDDWPGNFDPSTASGDPCNYLANGSEQSPVIIDLDDVKPGDFGEITFSFALCDNPGYLWLQGCLQDSSENGVTEPEADSSDEDQQEGTSDEPPLKSGSGDGTVELLDEVQAAWWYDNGDNLQSGGGGGGGGEVDVVIVFDESGSMDDEAGKFQSAKDGAKALTSEVLSNSGTQVGLVSFDGSAFLRQGLTTDESAVDTAIDNLSTGGGTDFDMALAAGREELTGNDVSTAINASGNNRSTADKVMVFLSNGSFGGSLNGEQDAVKNIPADLYAIAYGSGADETTLQEIASDPDSTYFFNAPTQPEVETAFDDIGGQISSGGEELVNVNDPQSQGSLREILTELCPDPPNDYGVPLDGDRSTQFDESNDPVDDSDREEFSASTRHDIAFAWWVPRSVGNQIQSDSATFSLSFYAVQSRNNPGFGNA